MYTTKTQFPGARLTVFHNSKSHETSVWEIQSFSHHDICLYRGSW